MNVFINFIIYCTSLFQISTISSAEDLTWCYEANFQSNPKSIPEFTRPRTARPGIYFVDTTCTSSFSNKLILTPRQGCAIESAARKNPNSDIYLLLASWTTMDINQQSKESEDMVVRKLSIYPNVLFRYLNLANFFTNTTFEDWFHNKTYNTQPFGVDHMHQLIRWIVLHKFGGTYLDMNLLSVRSVESDPDNVVGFDDDELIVTSVVKFTNNGIGGVFLKKFIMEMKMNYNSEEINTFDKTLMHLLRKRCRVILPVEMDLVVCKGVYVSSGLSHPIEWNLWKDINATIVNNDFKKIWSIIAKIKNSKLTKLWDRSVSKEGKGRNQLQDTVIDICPEMDSWYNFVFN